MKSSNFERGDVHIAGPFTKQGGMPEFGDLGGIFGGNLEDIWKNL